MYVRSPKVIVNDEVVRKIYRQKRRPACAGRWNWKKCWPLVAILTVLGFLIGAMAIVPVILWLLGGVWR